MILVSILFVGLWDDAACFELDLPLLQHQLVLLARPILDRSESEPIGGAVLVLAMDRMAGSQMLVRVPALNQRSNFMSPFFIPVTIEVISEVPVDIRVGTQPGDRITDVAPFVLTVCRRLGLVSRDVQNCRDNDIAVSGKAEHALPFLPIGHVEAGVIVPGVIKAVG